MTSWRRSGMKSSPRKFYDCFMRDLPPAVGTRRAWERERTSDGEQVDSSLADSDASPGPRVVASEDS